MTSQPQRSYALAALALLTSACVSTPPTAERAWLAGDLAGAKAAYELTLANEKEPGHDLALLRLAVIELTTGTSAIGLDRARAYLNELLSLFPASPNGHEARTLLGLLDARAAAERRIAELEADSARLAEQMRSLEGTIKGKDAQLDKLQTRLETSQAELRRLRQELGQLKRIDLQRHP